MDQGLKAQIHRYAENREIDYMSAKNLGNAYGVEFANEKELVEFKQTIDRYLKTFKEDAFAQVEEACKKKNKKKKVEEAYDIESFANKEDDLLGGFQPKKKGGKNPVKKQDDKRYKTKISRVTTKRQVAEGISLEDMFKI